jgi:hypothetical protein
MLIRRVSQAWTYRLSGEVISMQHRPVSLRGSSSPSACRPTRMHAAPAARAGIRIPALSMHRLQIRVPVDYFAHTRRE